MESGRFQPAALDLPDDMPLDDIAVDALAGALGTRVLETGEPWTGTPGDLASTTAPPWATAALERICVLPLMSRGQALGILAAGRHEDMAYTADETDFLMQVASLLAAAIQTTIIRDELQTLKRRFEVNAPIPKMRSRTN
jgi:formate hydrogenlyase transcriptional activator